MLQVDHPTGFEHTKKSLLYAHQTSLGSYDKRICPSSPHPNHLQQFYQRFSNSSQIESAIAIWYNSKLPEQRKNIADWKCVAFLADLTSLCEFTTEDEKLGDKRFNNNPWDVATKGYNLDFPSIVESKSENDDEGEEDDSDYGESIELEIANEDEDDITTRKKCGKGKEQEIEVDDNIEIELKDQDMEIDVAHNSNFIGGLTAAE
ncbi:hypothetical protein O181_119908 [Austropuccinia psidii MF-1]|uniref:Uncharacterized protein n=1 Tax=Austropuccinia psidii MF-1 TaxID=1389203 RepID=A0A9Q3KF20_9BASI|nr:hypothetical protein [Austropuccinia psidii MF-1]